MQQRSEDRLIAYLDGEVDVSERRAIEAWLDSDPAARDKLAALAQSDALVRSAFDEVMHEPLPDRLIAAARGERIPAEPSAKIVPFRRGRGTGAPLPRAVGGSGSRWPPRCSACCCGAVAHHRPARLPGGIGGTQPRSNAAAPTPGSTTARVTPSG